MVKLALCLKEINKMERERERERERETVPL
jgi:hypothetical protein